MESPVDNFPEELLETQIVITVVLNFQVLSSLNLVAFSQHARWINGRNRRAGCRAPPGTLWWAPSLGNSKGGPGTGAVSKPGV